MRREEEIAIILRSLLGKIENEIDKKQYSSDDDMVIEASKNVVKLTKEIENYLYDLKIL